MKGNLKQSTIAYAPGETKSVDEVLDKATTKNSWRFKEAWSPQEWKEAAKGSAFVWFYRKNEEILANFKKNNSALQPPEGVANL